MTVPDTSSKLVTIFGGSGFIGRYLVQAMARRGWRVRVAVRRPDLAGHLQPLGHVGQIRAIQANLRYRWSIDRAVEGADAVVNLVGILAQSGRQTFEAVQTFGPRAIAEAARAAGLPAIVHVSAIGADPHSDIGYIRSKGEGERSVLETLPQAVVMRPSIVFGPEDHFFNRFAAMSLIAPALPLIGGGRTRFQPVYVGDVAEALARAVEGSARPGTVYELGGPEVAEFRDLMRLMLDLTGRRRLLLPIPFGPAKILGRLLGLLPWPLLTYDQVRMLESDNVVSPAAQAEGRTLDGLGIDPTAMAVVLPTYLTRFRERGQFSKLGRS